MEFLKKHYEKIVLSVVLVAVAAAALYLTLEVGRVHSGLEDQLRNIAATRPKEFTPIDLAETTHALTRRVQGFALELDGPHNTFNPGTWTEENNQLRRKTGRGWIDLLEVEAIRPLNLIVQFSGVAGLAESPRYQFTVTREYEAQAMKRRPTMTSLTPGTKNDLFILREVKGSPENPRGFVCELVDEQQVFIVESDKPFIQTMGYVADLRYDGRDLKDKRVDDSVNLSGAAYKIVAISKDEIVVSAPNHVRSTLTTTRLQ
jgi:hypothetical protein